MVAGLLLDVAAHVVRRAAGVLRDGVGAVADVGGELVLGLAGVVHDVVLGLLDPLADPIGDGAAYSLGAIVALTTGLALFLRRPVRALRSDA